MQRITLSFSAADTSTSGGPHGEDECTGNRRARFDKLDVDDDGALSKDEFAVALKGKPMQRFQGLAYKRAGNDLDLAVYSCAVPILQKMTEKSE